MIPTFVRPSILMLTLALVAGCGGGASPEDIVKEQAALRQEIGKIVDSVTDEATANDAAPKIEAAMVKIGELQAKLNKITLSPEKKSRVQGLQSGSGMELFNKLEALKERNVAAAVIVASAIDKPTSTTLPVTLP